MNEPIEINLDGHLKKRGCENNRVGKLIHFCMIYTSMSNTFPIPLYLYRLYATSYRIVLAWIDETSSVPHQIIRNLYNE